MTTNRVRRNGSYAPLSAHYYKDDAIDEAGEAAELLYVRGLAFCADVLSDGFISERQLVRFVGVGMFDAAERAASLVKVGLWERVDGGYVVRSWLEWNRSREEITDAKAKDAARKRPSGQQDSEPPDTDPPPEGRADSSRNPKGVRAESSGDAQGTIDGVPAESGVPSSAGARARSTTDPRHSTPETPSAKAAASAKVEEEFAEWWTTYPKKVKKPEGLSAYKKARRVVSHEMLMRTVKEHIAAWRANDKDPQYIPYPASWLNGECYNDAPEPVMRRDGQASLAVVPDLPTSFEEIRADLNTKRAGELLGYSFVADSQPPSDSTPPDIWRSDSAARWLDEHEDELRSKLAERRAG